VSLDRWLFIWYSADRCTNHHTFYVRPEHTHSKVLTRLTESSLHLAEYCLVRYGFTTLVLIHDLRLLTDLLHNPAPPLSPSTPLPPSQHSSLMTYTAQQALLQIIEEYLGASRHVHMRHSKMASILILTFQVQFSRYFKSINAYMCTRHCSVSSPDVHCEP